MTQDVKAQHTPTKATFEVGHYSDGSGPVVEVKYDTASQYTSHHIWIESSRDQWIAIPAEHAEELCGAIMTAAKAIAAIARATGEQP